MKRIIIISEGQTEQEFCKDVLIPYFITKHIIIHYPTVKHSTGGIVPWPILKRQIETHLKQDKEAIVTTFIDFYGIHDRHLFPRWEEAKRIANLNNRMTLLETAKATEIDEDLRHRFVPYIQLHEFEGLLFNRIDVFRNNFSEQEADMVGIESVINRYPNPELINDGHDTAPSKRLGKLIKGYNKVVYGTILATEIGLVNLRGKSPRFNAWIETLERI
jgi:hypothetical protein